MRRLLEIVRAVREGRLNPRDFNGLLVGAFLGIAFVTLVIVSLITLSFHGIIGKDEYKLYCYFEKGLGLRTGGKVQVNGVNVGTVSNITLSDAGKVKLTFLIDRQFQNHITTTSKVFATRDQNLISERVILITNGEKKGFVLEPGSELQAGDAQDIETVLQNVIELVDRIDKIARVADTLLRMAMDTNSSVGALIGSDKLYRDIGRTVGQLEGTLHQANGIVGDIRGMSGDMKSLMNDAKTILPGVLHRTDTLTSQLIHMADTAVKIVSAMDTTIFSLNTMLVGANSLISNAGNLLVDADEKLERADDLIGSISRFWFIRNKIPTKDTISTFMDEEW